MKRRVAVVGAGIFGLAHAWAAIRAGNRVFWIERDAQAQGGSIRNFGMIWPVGQPLGESTQLALRSRQLWLEAAELAGVWVNPCGSLFLAHHPDELAVLEEYAGACARLGLPRKMLTSEQVLALSPAANPVGLRGGLLSETELAVDPPCALRYLEQWLRQQPDLYALFNSTVIAIEPSSSGSVFLQLADGKRLEVDQAIVCSGADLRTLFPREMTQSGMKLCKLQMLKTVAQPQGWRAGPHLASGLTLRHYSAFNFCPTLNQLKQRIAATQPELDRFGIHVMSSQNHLGEMILGDSHEYDEQIAPFDKQVINDLILRELAKVIRLPTWELKSTWNGVYAKFPDDLCWEHEPFPGVTLRTGLGGNGMTLAFGLAEKFFEPLGN